MEEKRRKKKKKGGLLPIILLVLLLIGILAGGGYLIFQRYYGLSNFISDHDVSKLVQAQAVNGVEVEVEDNGLTESEEEELRSEAAAATVDVIMPDSTSDIYNILLIGVDRRDRSWYGNSDSMILLSINKKAKSMHMISFMRDMYADIPGKGVHKLNAACAYGGGPLLVETIEDNYKVNIDNYASVDFPSMIAIVDYCGGVELTMSDAEAKIANDYIRVMCEEQHEDASRHIIPGGGTYLCDGYQAVGYARNRYTGNSDYQRTERQRTVLSGLMNNIRSMSLGEINTLVENILPLVTHNVESGTILKMVPQIPSILKYDLTTSRVPYDGMFSVKGEILVPDMAATIEKLQGEVYGE